MLKGCQREMIVVHTQKSKVFEHAYFVLRRECRTLQQGDLLSEANRLVQAVTAGGLNRKPVMRRRGAFFAGVLTGIALGAGLSYLFFALFGA